MSIPAWPANFPPPLREGYGYTQADLVLRTDFAFGDRVRDLYTDGPDEFEVSVILSAAQWAYLQGWHRYVIANGAAWFSLPLLAAGALETREVRLLGPLVHELTGIKRVRVRMPVKTRIGTTMDAETFEAFAAFPDADSAGFDLQALENFVNG